MVLMLCCTFNPFYVGPCPPGCLVPLTKGTPYCCNPCGGGCSSYGCGW